MPCPSTRLSSNRPCAFFFFSSRRRHTRYWRDWSSDVCSSDLHRRPSLERSTKGRGKVRPRPSPSQRLRGVTMAKEFECERDQVVIRGVDDDDLVMNVARHLAKAHPDLVGNVSREDVVAAARDGLTVRLRWVLASPPAAVYNALTEPRQLASW